jgi:hypothetical protein
MPSRDLESLARASCAKVEHKAMTVFGQRRSEARAGSGHSEGGFGAQQQHTITFWQGSWWGASRIHLTCYFFDVKISHADSNQNGLTMRRLAVVMLCVACAEVAAQPVETDGYYIAGQVSTRLGDAIQRAEAFDARRYGNDGWSKAAAHAIESASNWLMAAQVSMDGLQACYALRAVADKKKADLADGMLKTCRASAVNRLRAAAVFAHKLTAPTFPAEANSTLLNLAAAAEEGIREMR